MKVISAKDFEAQFGQEGASKFSYDLSAPSIFNTQAFKDVWTKAGEDVALGKAQGKANQVTGTGNTMIGPQTAIIQGGLAPFRSIAAGFTESEKGQDILGSAVPPVIDALTKTGQAITPDAVKKYVGDLAVRTIDGFNSKSPEEQLELRNKLGLAEGLSYLLGSSAIKPKPQTSLAGEFAAQQTTKTASQVAEDTIKSGLQLRESIQSLAGDKFVEPTLKTSVNRLVETQVGTGYLRGTAGRVEDVEVLYDNFLQNAEKAIEDIKAEPPISVVGSQIGSAFEGVIKQRSAVGATLGSELDNIGNLKVSIESAVRETLKQLDDSGLSYNPVTRQLTSFQGSKFVPQEIDMLNEFFAKMRLLGDAPSVRNIDNFISKTRTELAFTKGQNNVIGTTNAERIINGSLANLRGTLDPAKNGIQQLDKYWKANKTYSELSDFIEEGSTYLGKITQSGDFAKDASIAKSAVQSILNNGKKDWLLKLESLTGYQALDYSVLALQAMKDAGDFRGLSLLQVIKDQGIPTSKAGFVGAVIDSAADIGKRIVLGKPSEQTKAFLRNLSKEKTNLKTPDKIVRAKASIPKTKEITLVEKKIADNVKAQKAAIEAGDFTLVAKLKDIYKTLVTKLKALIEDYKKNGPPIGMSIRKSVTPESVAKKADQMDIRLLAKVLDDPSLAKNDANYKRIIDNMGLGRATEDELVKFAKDVIDEYEGVNFVESFDGKGKSFIQKKDGKMAGSTPKLKGTTDAKLRADKDVPMKDLAGNKFTVKSGTVLTPEINAKGQAILNVDGKQYVVPKNQYDNLKGQSTRAVASPFAPELDGLEETVKGAGNWKGDEYVADGKTVANVVKNEDGTWSYQSDLSEGSDTFKTRQEAMNGALDEIIDPYAKTGTKYSQYTLPGGEDYREVLLRAPEGTGLPDNVKVVEQENGYFSVEVDGVGMSSNIPTREKALKTAETYGGIQKENKSYKSSHWDEPNVIAHLRLNDRTWNGKKVTFMEELQSDWARDGRDKGFIGDTVNPVKEAREKLERKGITIGKDMDGSANLVDKDGEYLDYDDLDAETKALADKVFGNAETFDELPTGGVPNHPLLKNWQIPATKRALLDAVDRDSDVFAWINGAQTSERYKLSTKLENLTWKKALSGDITKISMKPVGGGQDIKFSINKEGIVTDVDTNLPAGNNADWKGKKLDEVLGKGMADSIMSKESGELAGEGLNFGGEWANNLYDRQVRDIVKKLTGAEVKTADMGLNLGKNEDFTLNSGRDVGGIVQPRNLEVGLDIANAKGVGYIITEVGTNGKFKAIMKSSLEESQNGFGLPKFIRDLKAGADIKNVKANQKEFSIGDKAQTQQYIELTPEVKAKIQSKAPNLSMKTQVATYGIPLLMLYFSQEEN